MVAETSGNMIYDYDLETGTIYRSDALRSVFLWDEIEDSEDWWQARVHPDDREHLMATVDPVLRSLDGPSHWAAEYRFRRGDGAYSHVLERGSVRRDAGGRPVRCVGTVSDVSDRAELALQLRQAQKMEAVGQLAGGIAHDFNNLLTAISCNVELLLDAIEPADARRDDVLQIRDAAARAAALTRQLLAYSRRQVLQPRAIDINTTVGAMERLLHRVISAEVRLHTSLGPSLPAVFADAGQVEQVVMNLVLNARDAMPAGGTISLSTATVTFHAACQHRFGVLQPGTYVTLSVRDEGAGIAPGVLDRLFEPFFTTKGQGKGTGLGLATVHGIVAQSAGQIVVETTPHRGSNFTVYLPAHESVAQPAVPPRAAAVSRPPSVRTVLLVDDERPVREVAIRAISRVGYRVLGASGGNEALQILETEKDHANLLLLTDVMMPGMNGFELADLVATRFPDVCLATMSGHSADEMVRHGLATPRHPLLSKPFTLPALAEFVESVFDARAQAAER